MNLKTGIFKNSILYAVLLFAMLFEWGIQAREICEARIDCPGNYSGITLELPDNLVMLSKTFLHCAPEFADENIKPGSVDTVSLFFLIDHSASMSVNDSIGNRYIVASRIIDSLRAKSPASEIGIAIFSNQLMHSYLVDNYARQLDPVSGWTDSYIPLTKLNSQVKGLSAADYLKSIINLDSTKDAGNNYRLTNGYYGRSGRHDGHPDLETSLSQYNGTTDISLAFEAALKAFQTASYPKKHHYIVLLSDGEPQFVDLERRTKINDFVNGTNTPTTLTAWLAPQKPIPSQIITMTQNIKRNGYSETNQFSSVWKTTGNTGELLSKLLKVTQPGGFRVIPSKPVRLSINNIAATRFDDSLAYMPSNIFFNKDSTILDVSFTYHFDPPMDVDSTRNFRIKISSKPNIQVPADIKINCWDQGIIKYFVNGVEVTGLIKDDDKNIEVRFYPPAQYPPAGNVTLTIQNRDGSDQFELPTASNGTYFYGTFRRENGSAKSDGFVLQNNNNDSIYAIYANKDIPLDIVKEGRRVGPARDIIPLKTWYLDQNADGFPDVIKVTQGKDRFTADELTGIKANFYVSSSSGKRDAPINELVATPQGFDIIIGAGSGSSRFTGLYPEERLYIRAISNLAGGGSLSAMSVAIEDSMAPVIADASFIARTRPVGGDNQFNDTLNITFSENVAAISTPMPFRFFNPESFQSYTMSLNSLSANGQKHTFLVTNISATNKPGASDSIWINESANIGDGIRNVQDNPLNHRAIIRLGTGKYTFTVVVCPTPADPQNTITSRIPDIYKSSFNLTQQSGILILIQPGQQISALDQVSAKITIYDQLGFPVVKDKECLINANKDKILFVWDGTNKQGRLVGDGIYSAIIKISVSTGAKETLKTKIGVLHDKK